MNAARWGMSLSRAASHSGSSPPINRAKHRSWVVESHHDFRHSLRNNADHLMVLKEIKMRTHHVFLVLIVSAFAGAIAFAQYADLPRGELELQVWMRAPHTMYVGHPETISVDVIHAYPDRVQAALDVGAGMKSRLVRKWILGRVTARFDFEITSETSGTQVVTAIARTPAVTASDLATISVRTAEAYRTSQLLSRYNDLIRICALLIIVLAVAARGPIARFARAEVVVAIIALFGLFPLLVTEWLGRAPTSVDYGLAGSAAAIGIFDVMKRFVDHARRRHSGVKRRNTPVAVSGVPSIHDSIISVPAGGYVGVRDVLDSLLARSTLQASEALRRAYNHMIFGVTIGLSGLVFFFLTTSALIPDTGSSGMSWSLLGYSLLKIAPRAAVLMFIEITAGFFLKQYSAAMVEYHNYERIERHREAETLSFLIRAQGGEKDGLDDFAKSLLVPSDGDILRPGENTTHQAAQERLPNDMLEIMKKAHESLVDLADAAKKLTKEDRRP